MSAMVEKLARAIAGMDIVAKQSGGVDERGSIMHYDDIVETVWPLYRGHATAALKIIRNLDEAVFSETAISNPAGVVNSQMIAEIYRAVIAEAMK